MDEGQLRTALKQVFDKFDTDGSGAVSTDEMSAMVKQLNMNLTPPRIRKMMVEADRDMSGEIDFEEFVAVVQKQIREGGGGDIASIVSQAGGLFGYFGNVLGGLFGSLPPTPPSPSQRPPSRPPSSRRAASPPTAPLAAPPVTFSDEASPSGSPNNVGPSAGDNLFERYMSPAEKRATRALGGSGQTRTTRLRARGVKLACYLNTEVDCGRVTVISLPEECDTLGEVMPMIQRSMQLDRRMKYAAELYLPDGAEITEYKPLVDAAALDIAIIVGCGEPFDPNCIPFDIAEFQRQGGGRRAADKVKKLLQEKKREEAYDKAQKVRHAGHGTDSRAVITSREQHQEENREQAMQQRQEYVEQLMYRAAQNKNLMDRVHQNSVMHKMEQDESRAKREEFDRVRLETLADQRRMDKEISEAKKAEMGASIKAMHDKVKTSFEASGFYQKSKRLTNIARSGSSKGTR